MQQWRSNGGVRDDKGEHGGKVRCNHARALGNAVDRDFGTIDLNRTCRELAISIRRHDGARRLVPIVFVGLKQGRADTVDDGARIKRLADDAGGGDIDLAGTGTGGASGSLNRRFDSGHTRLAGEGIGIAGIDDNDAA